MLGLFVCLTASIYAQAPGSGGNDPLAGQDTMILENERIEDVIDSEKPSLQMPYQEIKPSGNEEVQYTSQDFYVETDFEPSPPTVKPLKPQRKPSLRNNFIKLGFGRFITPLLQLAIGNGREDSYEYGLDFTHFSAHKDGKLEFRKFREDYGTLKGAFISKEHRLSGKLHFYNTEYYNYADSLFTDRALDSARMTYTRVVAGLDLATLYDPAKELSYNLGGQIRLYTDRRSNRELHIDITPGIDYMFLDNLHAGAFGEITYSNARIGGQTQNRFYASVQPRVRYAKDAIDATAGVNLDFYTNSVDTSSSFKVFPHIQASYAVNNMAKVEVGYSGRILYNQYSQMIQTNRFLDDSIQITPTIEKMNIHALVSGNANNKLDYMAKVSFRRQENALVYTLGADSIFFESAYDSLTSILGIDLNASYHVSEEIKAGLGLSFNNYKTSTLQKYFHAVPLRLDVFASYTWNKKLTAKLESYIFGKTPLGLNASGEIVNRNVMIDLNLGVDYRISERFSVFLEANNLLANKYQRWLNYLERPFDYKGGITFIF